MKISCAVLISEPEDGENIKHVADSAGFSAGVFVRESPSNMRLEEVNDDCALRRRGQCHGRMVVRFRVLKPVKPRTWQLQIDRTVIEGSL